MDHPFATKTPILVNVRTIELIYDEVKVFADRMIGTKGNDICYLKAKGAPHDIILAGKYSSFVKEAEDTMKPAGEIFGLSS